MEMLLMVLCMSMFAMGITCLAFGAATRSEKEARQEQPHLEPVVAVAPTRFFARDLATPLETRPRVPIEALLLQIESHVRLEQAVAETFLESPTSVLLHSRTASPFLN